MAPPIRLAPQPHAATAVLPRTAAPAVAAGPPVAAGPQVAAGWRSPGRPLPGRWASLGLAAVSAAGWLGLAPVPAGAQALPERWLPAQTTWTDPPAPAPATEGLAVLPGTRLWFTDTGGDGDAVVLLHAYSGSYAMWAYQQPVLAAAGYRVIAYSARGHLRSDALDPDAMGSATEDLRALLDHLGISAAHLVGVAGGGLVPPDFAIAYPDRVLSLTISSSIAGVDDPDFEPERLMPREITALPTPLMEVGPSYRVANPEGLEEWTARQRVGWSGGSVHQPTNGPLSWEQFRSIRAPLLLMTGDADLAVPPSRMRQVARRGPPSELVILAEAGHAAYWEQPEAFNAVLLDFLGRHRAR